MQRSTTTDGPEILTGEAARLLAISSNHVRYLERTGQLRSRRIGGCRVYLRAEIEALALDRYRKATGQPHWRGTIEQMGRIQHVGQR